MRTRNALILGVALATAFAFAPARSNAASFGPKCSITGDVRPAVAAAIEAGSQDDLVQLLLSDLGYAADIMLAARSAGPEDLYLLAFAMAQARLVSMSNGNEQGARLLAAAAACGDKQFREAQAKSFRFILARGVAPDYEVPLFYDNFGGGLVSPN